MRPEGSPIGSPIPAPAVPAPDAVPVVGIPLGLTDYEHTLDWIDATVEHGDRGYVCVCNVHAVMAAAEDPELRDALLGSSLNVPDGQPLVWALVDARAPARGPGLRSRADGARPARAAPRPASASTCTAGATRARWSSSRSTCAAATRGSRSSAATRPRIARSPTPSARRSRGDQRVAG